VDAAKVLAFKASTTIDQALLPFQPSLVACARSS